MSLKVRQYLQKLKRDFPLRKPVSVRIREVVRSDDGSDLYGTCCDGGERFQIVIASHADESVMCDSLFHEWCHAILWPKCSVRHTDLFFKTYGMIYRHYLDD